MLPCCVRCSTAIRRIRCASARARRFDTARRALRPAAELLDYQPALGAGTTGLDSTQREEAQGKSGSSIARSSSTQPAGAGSAADPNTAPPADAQLAIRRSSPKQRLQSAGAPLAARIYNPTRAGAPPATIDAAIATVATTPPSRRLFPEEKPFDPLGVQLGAFIFRPAMEYTRGFDNNPARNTAPPAQNSWFNIYSPELLINSNWAVHDFNATIRGSYTTYNTMHQLDRPTNDAKAVSRIDVTSQSASISKAATCCSPTVPAARTSRSGFSICRSPIPAAPPAPGTASTGSTSRLGSLTARSTTTWSSPTAQRAAMPVIATTATAWCCAPATRSHRACGRSSSSAHRPQAIRSRDRRRR